MVETETCRAVGNPDSKASADSTVVLFHTLVDRHDIVTVLRVVIRCTAAADIGDQQTVPTKFAGGVAVDANTDTSLSGRSILVLAGDQGCMCIVYILCKGLIDGKTDERIACRKREGRRRKERR